MTWLPFKGSPYRVEEPGPDELDRLYAQMLSERAESTHDDIEEEVAHRADDSPRTRDYVCAVALAALILVAWCWVAALS